MSKTPLCKALLLLMTLIFLAGCWDYHDIETRVFIMGLAVDMDPAAVEERLLITVEMPHTGAGGGGEGEQGGLGQESKTLARASGPTVAQAVVSLNNKLERLPLWEQMIAVVVSEDVARNHLNQVFDLFLRSVRLNARARIFVADGTAGDIFLLEPRLQPLVSRLLRQIEVQFAELPRFALPQDIHTIKRPIDEGPTLAPRVTLVGGELMVSGAAVLAEEGFIGWLNEEEAEGANWIFGDVRRSIVSFPCPIGDSGSASLLLEAGGRRIRVSLDGEGQPKFHITLNTSARVFDLADCPMAPERRDHRRALERSAQEALERTVQAAITRAQVDLRRDFLRLGVYIKRNHPRIWDPERWAQAFPDVPITVEARITIRDPGGIDNEARI